jgi:hypothetical protein
MYYRPQKSVTRVTTVTGETFDADLSSTLERLLKLPALGGNLLVSGAAAARLASLGL